MRAPAGSLSGHPKVSERIHAHLPHLSSFYRRYWASLISGCLIGAGCKYFEMKRSRAIVLTGLGMGLAHLAFRLMIPRPQHVVVPPRSLPPQLPRPQHGVVPRRSLLPQLPPPPLVPESTVPLVALNFSLDGQIDDFQLVRAVLETIEPTQEGDVLELDLSGRSLIGWDISQIELDRSAVARRRVQRLILAHAMFSVEQLTQVLNLFSHLSMLVIDESTVFTGEDSVDIDDISYPNITYLSAVKTMWSEGIGLAQFDKIFPNLQHLSLEYSANQKLMALEHPVSLEAYDAPILISECGHLVDQKDIGNSECLCTFCNVTQKIPDHPIAFGGFAVRYDRLTSGKWHAKMLNQNLEEIDGSHLFYHPACGALYDHTVPSPPQNVCWCSLADKESGSNWVRVYVNQKMNEDDDSLPGSLKALEEGLPFGFPLLTN